jgi:hypothetical protein
MDDAGITALDTSPQKPARRIPSTVHTSRQAAQKKESRP